MLHPKGMHGLKLSFLKKLLQHLEIDDFNLSNVKVQREFRKIDLLITNDNQAIIIENKLRAIDQPLQLQRYYEELTAMGYRDIRIYYLSIDGKNAEDYSIGNLTQHPDFKRILQNISYEYDISNWLEECIKEAYNKATLRETLIQYRKLIQEISGKTMGREEQTEMVNLIAQNDNILQAQKIAENWVHVHWHTEWRFWTNLEEIIAKEYSIKDLQKYSDKKITSNIHQSRNRNPWFGLMFSIGSFKGDDACIFIERGDEDVYYGLTMVRNNTKEHSNDPKFQPLREKLKAFTDWQSDQHWIGGNYALPKINFNTFSDENTLRLLNDNFRTIYINNLWEQMKTFVAQSKQALIDANPDNIGDIIIISNP
jgi:hypothetical protein